MPWVIQYHDWVGFVGIDIFIECLQMLEDVLHLVVAEVSLTFAWCTCYLHGVWRWFFMVCGDGCILRAHVVLGKGVVYVFIWHVILGLRMVSLLCHDILLIHIYNFDMLWYVHMEHAISFGWGDLDHVIIFMFVRQWLTLWHWSWFSFLVLSTLIICWILHDIAMFHLELAWIGWLYILMDTQRWWWC